MSVTIEQVAARAGVSRSTASRVVNNSTSVSPEALEAVHAAIAELNYVPNRAARALASRQTHAIGVIIPEDTTRVFADPFFAQVVTAIHHRLASSNYILNLFIVESAPNPKTLQYLNAGNIDGAIVVSHHAKDTYLDELKSNVPIVYGGRPLREKAAANDYYVDTDNYGGARAAMEYLVGNGHKNIATITGPMDMNAAVDRFRAYRDVLRESGLPEGQVEDGEFTAKGGTAATRRILANGVPDAIFASSDMMAAMAILELKARDIRVPEDVAVVGFDDLPLATNTTPELTTVSQSPSRQGELLAETLIDILGGLPTERVKIVPAKLMKRDSA